MAEIHAARRAAAARQVAEAGADAALITSAPNVRYLTGLASSNAAVLVPAQGTAVLATDSRYELAARRDCPDVELVVERFLEALLAAACRISDQAIADTFARIRPGLTERQLAAALDRRMVDLGAERPAFETIVASGPNGAVPHH